MTETERRTLIGAVAALTYAAGILGTNALSAHCPTVEMFGLIAPAGTFAAALVLTLRDIVQDTLGATATVVAILLGTALAALTASPHIAAVSAIAFAASETVDALVYTTLRTRSRLLAITISNLTGLTIDSLLFVPLAFGTFTAVPGQIVGKTAATLASTGALAALHRPRAAAR